MKPTFALDLSREVIALLRRTPKGWLTIGEVAFDAPDLAATLDHYRKAALGISPLGLACKVILPSEQVLYTEIHAPGPSREDKRAQIAAALEGRTPYPVEDLVFDWSGKGSQLRVAVVARQTLEEAEAFAGEHRLNPVSFVAVPAAGTFFGEAWFGPSSVADTVLAPGETVERDREAVVVLDREAPAPDPRPDPAPTAEVRPSPPPLPPQPPQVSDGVAAQAEPTVPPRQAAPDPVKDGWKAPPPPPEDPPKAEANVMEPPPAWPAAAAAAVAAPGGEALTRPASPPVDRHMPPPLPPDTGTSKGQEAAVAVEEAPFTDVADESEPPERWAAPATRVTASVLADDISGDDLPPAPSSAAMLAFSSRRSGAALTNGARPPRAAGTDGPRQGGSGAAAHPAAARRPPMATATATPALPPTAKVKPIANGTAARPLQFSPPKLPVRSKNPFETAPPSRRRTGFIFVVMVVLLLVSLALVAAWASYFLEQASEGTRSDAPTVVAQVPAVEDEGAAVIPAVEDEMAADLQAPVPTATDSAVTVDETATPAAAVPDPEVTLGEPDAAIESPEAAPDALATGTPVPGTLAPDTAAETTLAAGPAPEPAAREPAVTVQGVGVTPAEGGAALEPVPAGSGVAGQDQDEIFLATMDAPPPAFDALMLPPLAATSDAPPAAPMPPPVFGTVYQFDARGLLVPTPEGILSPEGIMLFAGVPPRVPQPRSPAAAEAAAAFAATATREPPVAGTASPAAGASLVTGGQALAQGTDITAAPEGDAEAPPQAVAADPSLAGARPRPRPEGLAPDDDGASLAPEAGTDVTTRRPLARPDRITTAAASSAPATATDLGAQAASLTAQAGARIAAATALEAANPSVVAISMRPAARPNDLSRAVEAAVAAALREPDPAPAAGVQIASAAPIDPEELEELTQPEVESTAPSIPTRANVADQATLANAINLKKVNLIGTFGSQSRPYALIRQPNGRYKRVTIGDRIDGGVVKSITMNEVRYQKGGRLLSLKVPGA